VSSETPVTVGQVEVHLGMGFTSSADLHEPEQRSARDEIKPPNSVTDQSMMPFDRR